MSIDEVMRSAPVIPVLVLDGSLDPAALAETLVEAGLPVIEITLRTPSALPVMKAMASVEGAMVGAGTVLNERILGEDVESGAKFIVSTGLTERLGMAAIASGVPFLPGVANAGDIMRARPGVEPIQILSGRGVGRLAGAKGTGRAVRRGALLHGPCEEQRRADSSQLRPCQGRGHGVHRAEPQRRAENRDAGGNPIFRPLDRKGRRRDRTCQGRDFNACAVVHPRLYAALLVRIEGFHGNRRLAK